MISPPAVADTLLPPGRVLSDGRPLDYLRVACWAIWAPRKFEEYCRYLSRTHGESAPPSPLDVAAMDRWLAANPGHHAFSRISVSLWITMIFGILAIDTACIVPFLPEYSGDTWKSVGWFLVMVFVMSLLTPLVSWFAARADSNVGELYAWALQGVLVVHVAMLLIAWWLPLQYYYVSKASGTTAVVFLMGGWGIGFLLNLVAGGRRMEFDRLVNVLLLCIVPILLTFVILQLASDIPGGTESTTLNDAQGHGLRTWLFWSGGFMIGLLRPVDWFVSCIFTPLPGLRSRQQGRAWRAPGTTLIPAWRLQERLGTWLEYDWQRGMRIASDLSRVSCQQRPLTAAVRAHLVATRADQLPEKLSVICDSDAFFALQIIRPPVAGYPKSAGTEQTLPVQVTPSQQRYQQEVALADVLDHRQSPPELHQHALNDALHAAFWYYSQGYLYAAADIVQRSYTGSDAPPSIVTSPAFVEFRTLVATFQALQDLRTVSAQPTAVLPTRPPSPQRAQTWALLDEFIAAGRWVWRARRSQGPAREVCLREFNRIITHVENAATTSSLADRRLITGTVQLWRRQVVPLLNDMSAATVFVPVKLRPWESVYLELGFPMCPWLQVIGDLNREWQPGKTAITFVASQPMAGARQAIEEAVKRNPTKSVLAVCDLTRWVSAPIGLDDFSTALCRDIAGALNANDRVPEAAILNAFTLDAKRDLIGQLCSIDQNQTIVLLVDNVHLMQRVVSPGGARDRAIQFLGQLESQFHNLALTFHSTDRDDTWWRFKRRIAPARACPEIKVLLLSQEGVQQWLDQQFREFGPYFTAEAVGRAYTLTGGHPALLASLSQSLAVSYNAQTPDTPISPLLDVPEVDSAAATTLYRAKVQDFSTALARQLKHDFEPERRLLMYLVASYNAPLNRPATADELARSSAIYPTALSAPDITARLENWVEYGVISATETPVGIFYGFRSLSFARWVDQQGPTI